MLGGFKEHMVSGEVDIHARVGGQGSAVLLLLSLSLLDIVPTLEMFANVNAEVARAYWHWFFLQQPFPYPEKLIEASSDHFYEGFFSTLGNMRLDDFDQAQLQAYRCAWRDPGFIRASCADYRTTASIDCALDQQDLARQVDCPSLVLWGSAGVLAQRFDVRSLWAKRLAQPQFATVNGGHFFVDPLPVQTAEILGRFLDNNSMGGSPAASSGVAARAAES